jgi:hypothetical protein
MEAPAKKIITENDKAVEASRPFFFPDHGITVLATSKEAAEKQVAEKTGGATMKE